MTGVTVTPGSDAGAIDVGWTAATGAASYKVQWKTSSQQWDATNRQTTSTTISATISNLTAGTQYSVRVAASNTSGYGPWSDTATGTAATGGVTLSTTSLAVPEGGSAVYTVRLATVPSATVYVDMAKRSGGDADLTFSPPQLTFTTKGWDLPQTVTVSAAEDTDAARGAATITHTATSTDTSYGSSLSIASVAATEADTAPASADVTLAVSRDNRTAIPLRDLPFTGEGGATLHAVKIVSLPGASDGTLGLVKTGIHAASTVLCVGTITPITAGQVVVDAVSAVLYFCPKDGFNRTTFEFQVVDSQGRTSGAPRTATLVGPPRRPSRRG